LTRKVHTRRRSILLLNLKSTPCPTRWSVSHVPLCLHLSMRVSVGGRRVRLLLLMEFVLRLECRLAHLVLLLLAEELLLLLVLVLVLLLSVLTLASEDVVC
jgi:hypothetical protein